MGSPWAGESCAVLEAAQSQSPALKPAELCGWQAAQRMAEHVEQQAGQQLPGL